MPELSSFVATARDDMPTARGRVTTAQSRGNLRGRGRGNTAAATRAKGKGKLASEADGSSFVPAAARGRGSRGRGNGAATRGTGKNKRKAPEEETSQPTPEESYRTGPGSAYHMLFGDDTHRSHLPDLNESFNEPEEVPVSQNAPQ